MTNPTVFAFEKKKRLDSVFNILEKEIKFERFRSPYADRTDNQKLISEMSRIGQKLSQDNNIPFSAFEEIFKNSDKTASLFTILRFGEKNDYHSEDIEENKTRRKLKR